MSSYRAEAYGRLAAIQFLIRYTEFLHIQLQPTLDIVTATDSDSLLRNETTCKQQTIPNAFLHLNPDSDVVDKENV